MYWKAITRTLLLFLLLARVSTAATPTAYTFKVIQTLTSPSNITFQTFLADSKTGTTYCSYPLGEVLSFFENGDSTWKFYSSSCNNPPMYPDIAVVSMGLYGYSDPVVNFLLGVGINIDTIYKCTFDGTSLYDCPLPTATTTITTTSEHISNAASTSTIEASTATPTTTTISKASSTSTTSTTTIKASSSTTTTTTKTSTSTSATTTCLTGYKGHGNGDGPSSACCSSEADCIDDCVSGKCGSPAATSTKATATTTKSGSTSPTSNTCVAGYSGKKNGKGSKGVCCSTEADCIDVCVKGVCNA